MGSATVLSPRPAAAGRGSGRGVFAALLALAACDKANEAGPAVPVDVAALYSQNCARCHGNDGRGDTELGRGLYPRAPDMTLPATQELSDGELFWIIENGVRLTGMPAWGDLAAEGGHESWELVHFIRRLPHLTAEEIAEMERHNPVSRAALEEEAEIERFLAGEGAEGGEAEERREAPAAHHHH